MIRILSAKLVEEISVVTPFTTPETSRDPAGNWSGLTSIEVIVIGGGSVELG